MSTNYTPSLPIEIWHSVSSNLDRRDHLSLISVNKAFNAIFISELFATIVIEAKREKHTDLLSISSRIDRPLNGVQENKPTSSYDPHSRFSTLGERACMLLEMLHSRLELASYVRQCELRYLSLHPPDPVDYVITFIGNLPRLEKVNLCSVNIPVRHLVYLCSRPQLSLAIGVENSTLVGRLEQHEGTDFTANCLKLLNSFIYPPNNPTLTTIVVGGSLQELIMVEPAGAIAAFFEFHSARGSPLLPQLRILELAWLSAGYFSFFESTPNLVELRLLGPNAIALGEEPLPEGILPNLQRISAHSSFLRLLVPSRPVKTINTGEDPTFSRPSQGSIDERFSLNQHGKCFGSTAVLQRLAWTQYTRGKELFQYIAEYCTQLTYLEVVIGKVWQEVCIRADKRCNS
jgi:hypothetical protein